jgi:general nucleoside transport system permease protein
MILSRLLFPALAAVAGLLAAGLVATVAGENPFQVLAILARSAFGSRFGFGYTLYYATPLLLTGLAVAVPYRAGLFNIGAEGQLMVGALFAAAAGVVWSDLPGVIAVPLGIAAAVLGGAVWGYVPGWLRARRGTHEVIVTILMNLIALSIVNWFILNPLKDPASQVPETLPIGDGYRLGWRFLPGTPANAALFIALFLAAILHVLLSRTVWGYETAASGANPDAARSAGIDVGRVRILSMVVAGGIAGLVGVNEVMGQAFRLKDGFSPGFGYTGIAVALLGRGHPLGVIPAAFFFGGLHKGAADLDLDTEMITRDLALVMQAAVIFAVVLEPYLRGRIRFLFPRRNREAESATGEEMR